MSKVVLDVSMSLDGCITGPTEDLARVHDWMSWDVGATGSNGQVIEAFFRTTGAVVMGRGMWDAVDGPNGWGPNGWVGPDGMPIHLPVFVLTHQGREAVTRGKTTFTFITDGIESALGQAKAAANGRNIVLQGANIAQQYLKARLVDEIEIHLVPVLLGEGIRLFEHLGTERMELERTHVLEAPGVTHLSFRVIK